MSIAEKSSQDRKRGLKSRQQQKHIEFEISTPKHTHAPTKAKLSIELRVILNAPFRSTPNVNHET